nr:LPXTG cell wall anchor domain-containing protein [Mammaliicoccus sciuri]
MSSNDSNNNGGNGDANQSNENNQDHKASHNKQLPDTGEESEVNTTLIGGLLAGLGSLFLFGRRRKEDK